MMSTGDTSGPAFPYHGPDALKAGMTLRDYFAAKAMQAIIGKLPVAKNDEGNDYFKAASSGAYGYADAMLEARK